MGLPDFPERIIHLVKEKAGRNIRRAFFAVRLYASAVVSLYAVAAFTWPSAAATSFKSGTTGMS